MLTEGNGCQELSRKGYNDGIIHTGWWTMFGDVLQNYLPNYVFFKGLWK